MFIQEALFVSTEAAMIYNGNALTGGLTHRLYDAIPIGGLPSCYATREQHLQYIPTSTKL